jgi:hypothetical protein
VLTGKLVTVAQLNRERANDKDTIRILSKSNDTYGQNLPKMATSLEGIEHVMKEIQEAPKQVNP